MRPVNNSIRTTLTTIAATVFVLTACEAAAFKFDIPKPTGYVVDEAGVLGAGTKKKLIEINQELERKTGSQIAIVVVPSTKPEPPFDYAMAIAESWKPGSAEKDNGVVFLVATKDRKLQILTGYGVEGVLPDGFVGEIRDRVVRPAFRAGDYGRGILDATSIMAGRIAKDAGVTLDGIPQRRASPRNRDEAPSLAKIIFSLLSILFFFGFRWLPFIPGRVHRRGYGYYGGAGGFGGGGFGGGGGGGFGGFGGGGFGGGGGGGGW